MAAPELLVARVLVVLVFFFVGIGAAVVLCAARVYTVDPCCEI